MSAVFVDTSGLVAVLDGDDPRHASARDTLADLTAAGVDLVTHGYVVAEAIAVVRRRLGTEAVLGLIDALLPAIRVVSVELPLHVAGLQLYRDSLPSATSFVDRVSLLLMETERIDTVFAIDGDFRLPGVRVIPA